MTLSTRETKSGGTDVENIYYCYKCEEIQATTASKATCPNCEQAMESAGWWETKKEQKNAAPRLRTPK